MFLYYLSIFLLLCYPPWAFWSRLLGPGGRVYKIVVGVLYALTGEAMLFFTASFGTRLFNLSQSTLSVLVPPIALFALVAFDRLSTKRIAKA